MYTQRRWFVFVAFSCSDYALCSEWYRIVHFVTYCHALFIVRVKSRGLDGNNLEELPENVFSNLENLEELWVVFLFLHWCLIFVDFVAVDVVRLRENWAGDELMTVVRGNIWCLSCMTTTLYVLLVMVYRPYFGALATRGKDVGTFIDELMEWRCILRLSSKRRSF